MALLQGETGDLKALAKVCSKVENEWVGAETGLLDQFASLLSQHGHVLRIDFRSLDVEPHPLELGDWQLVTLDSGATHSIAASGYNERRAECRAVCKALGIQSLRDAGDLSALDGTLLRRARHVVSENARVDATAAALDAHDLPAVAELLDASHASLRDDYQASVPEVEAAVQAPEGRRRRRRPDGRRRLRRLGARAPRARRRPARRRPGRHPRGSRPAHRVPSSSPNGRVKAHTRKNRPTASIPRPA